MKLYTKYFAVLLFGVFLTEISSAQRQELTILFSAEPADTSLQNLLTQKLILQPNLDAIQSVFNSRPEELILSLPVPGRNLKVDLQLVKLLSDNFDLNTSGKDSFSYQPGAYYRGTIEGCTKSFAAISFFSNSFMAVLSDSTGNFVFGQLKNNSPQPEYVCYNDRNLLILNPFKCGVIDDDGTDAKKVNSGNPTVQSGNCIRVYFECDYSLYLDNGSNLTTEMNFVTGMFNAVSTLYANETINMTIGSIFLWTTQDPFLNFSSGFALSSFETYRTFFNGDVGMMLSTSGYNNGGLAHVSALCTPLRTCYGEIYNSYSALPTYSWTVEVVAHEIGHTLGSRHTHWCGWIGGPIDTCNVCFSLPTEGSCGNGPVPIGGGTIMSYCHGCSNIGINFSNGFGIQPGNAIRNFISSSSCVSCTVCNPPPIPVPTFGSATAPGTLSGISPVLTWNGSAPDYLAEIRKFPFNGNDVVNPTTTCISGNSVTAAPLPEGIVYRYEISGHTGTCGSWCISDLSTPMYFYVPPTLSCPSYICSGDSALISIPDLGQQFTDCIISYQWYYNTTLVPGATNFSYMATAPGNYYVEITYSTNNGVPAPVTIQSTSCSLTGITAPGPLVISGPHAQCENYTAVLSVPSCTGCNYIWSNGQNTAMDYIFNTGTYTITVWNACGYDTASQHVEFIGMPDPPVITGNNIICPGDSVILSISNLCSICNYTWSNGVHDTSITVTSPGNYNVHVANNCYDNNSDNFSVTNGSQNINPTTQNFGFAGGADSISVTSSSTCSWTATTTDSWIHILNSSGTGNGIVHYTVDSCSSSMNGTGTIVVANHTYTVTQSCLSTGIEVNESTPDFILFPNPVSENVMLSANGFNGNCTVTVYDAIGRLLIVIPVNDVQKKFSVTIPVSDLASGLYWVRVTAKEKSITQKLIKE